MEYSTNVIEINGLKITTIIKTSSLHIAIISPQFTLYHDRLDSIIHSFWRISMAFEQPLNHYTHFCPC